MTALDVLVDTTPSFSKERYELLVLRERAQLASFYERRFLNAAPQIRPMGREEAVAGFGHEAPERDSASAAPIKEQS